MTDRLDDVVAALDEVPVRLEWTDVVARHADGEGVVPLGAPGGPTGPRRRMVLAACLAVVAGVGVVGLDPEPVEVTSEPEPTASVPSTSVPSTTAPVSPTTLPAEGTFWGSTVPVWTGSDYLVWSGQVGGDGYGRADGWRHDPVTGATRDIPVAPIPPRDSAAGVWTGTELVVCCGRSLSHGEPRYDTASAAAYDPGGDTWRRLADPPAAAGGYVAGAVWTGSEMLVLVQTGDPNLEATVRGQALFSYDPVADVWSERAAPPFGDRMDELVWAGDRLVLWPSSVYAAADTGAVYDPGRDEWTLLPEQPAERPVTDGSVGYADGQVVVWGLDASDDTRTVGYRLRLGDDVWRPVSAAPLPEIDYYNGTPGSQTLVADPDGSRLIVAPVTGGESSVGGVEDAPLPPLLTYDPGADVWTTIERLPLGYAPQLTVGDDAVLVPDRANPVLTRLDG